MTRISRMLRTAWLPALLMAATPVLSDTVSDKPVIESTSSGLITFSEKDKAIRVAAVFVLPDDATVPTLVRYLDARGNVLKQVRGELSEGRPVIAELTRRDVAHRSDLLVRVEVFHKLPGVRDIRYPILVTTQPLALNGSARLALFWPGGPCGNPIPPGAVPGQPIQPGTAVMCNPPTLTDF